MSGGPAACRCEPSKHFGNLLACRTAAEHIRNSSWRSGWRARRISIDINGVAELDRLARDGGTLSIGAGVRHAAFHRPIVEGAHGRACSPPSSATSRIIRSAPAARFAAASRMPIRPRNGAWSRRRSAPRWSLEAARGTARSCRGGFLSGHHDDRAGRGRNAGRGALADSPTDTRFGFYEFNRRAGDFAMAMALVTFRLADGVIVEARVGIGGAEARPRRIAEAEAALHGAPPTTRRSARRRRRRPTPSIRSKTSSPMRNIAATWFAPSRAARWSAPPHERAHQRLRNDLGRPRRSGGWRTRLW